MMRLFDHLDLRVRHLGEARRFYDVLLPALGFPRVVTTPHGLAYLAATSHPKPEFLGLIEDAAHCPNATRLAFWAESAAAVDHLATLAQEAGARAFEAPAWCPEYSPTYYAAFFEDPSGNRLEICCRVATPVSSSP